MRTGTLAMANLVRTDDVVTAAELREIIGGPIMGTCIAVCAGEWRKEPDGRWRVWATQEWIDDEKGGV